jgi:hypothetical protein
MTGKPRFGRSLTLPSPGCLAHDVTPIELVDQSTEEFEEVASKGKGRWTAVARPRCTSLRVFWYPCHAVLARGPIAGNCFTICCSRRASTRIRLEAVNHAWPSDSLTGTSSEQAIIKIDIIIIIVVFLISIDIECFYMCWSFCTLVDSRASANRGPPLETRLHRTG